MRSAILLFGLLSLAPELFAASAKAGSIADPCLRGAIEVLSCRRESPTRSAHSVRLRSCSGQMIAQILRPHGALPPVLEKSFRVHEVKLDTPLNHAPLRWEGDGFSLTVASIQAGRLRGRCKATLSGGTPLYEDVICVRTR